VDEAKRNEHLKIALKNTTNENDRDLMKKKLGEPQ
jgi:hypothetical protein